jgi:hypothetical protein
VAKNQSYIIPVQPELILAPSETVEEIRENPYLQYFIGQSSYSNELAFYPSLLVHFRQRISPNLINKVNERMVEKMREITERQNQKKRIRTPKMSHPIAEN